MKPTTPTRARTRPDRSSHLLAQALAAWCGLAALAAPSCAGQRAVGAEALGAAPEDAAEPPRARSAGLVEPPERRAVLVLRRVAEPRVGAFDVLVPPGWRVESALLAGDDPNDPNEALSARAIVEARLDLAVLGDDVGAVQVRWLPDRFFVAPSAAPAGDRAGFPVRARPRALEFIRGAFRELRPQAVSVTVSARRALPNLAAEWTKTRRAAGLQARHDAACVDFDYVENGRRYFERWVAVIEDFGPAGGGLWSSRATSFARAPEAQTAALDPILRRVHGSLRASSGWPADVAAPQPTGARRAGQLVRIAAARLASGRHDHDARTNTQLEAEAYFTAGASEEYLNPFTRSVERDTAEYRYRWTNPAGDLVYTNHGRYDPNHDPRLDRGGFRRTILRERVIH